MYAAGMKGHTWTYNSKFLGSFRYLTAMDAIKFIVGRREKILSQSNSLKENYKTASHYYKLWSMPGQSLGQQKFRGETNYENLDYRLDV